MFDEYSQDLAVLGKYHKDHRGPSIVTGTYSFSCDTKIGNKLHARTLCSPYAHAKILSIDTSRTEAMEGVEAVITYEDNPFWSDTMLCWGQEFAAVAAVDEYTAERAMLVLLEDVEWDVMDFCIHPDDSVASGAPNCGVFEDTNVGPPQTYSRGDVEVGFAEADVIVEVDTGGWCRPHTMNTIEPNSACVWWEGDDIFGYDVNQAPHSYGRAASGYLGIPQNRYHVEAHAAGGGFGGGGQTREPVAAGLLSKKAGKPVQITRSRRNQSPTRRNKYGVKGRIKIGCKYDGTMTALEIDANSWGGRNGANSNWTQIIDTTYDTENISYTSHSIATNTGFAAGWR